MASVFDVAKYILHKQGRMSTWKLQKLCYYAQAWSMVWDEVPLFGERIEAWANGPVCPRLFEQHRSQYSVDDSMLAFGSIDNLTDTEKETIDSVLDFYGDKPGHYLRELSHQERPWRLARGDCEEGQRCTKEITTQSMQEYYGSL